MYILPTIKNANEIGSAKIVLKKLDGLDIRSPHFNKDPKKLFIISTRSQVQILIN